MSAIRATPGSTLGTAGLLAGAAILLAGCADLGRAMRLNPDPIDPTSAVAEQVRTASRAEVKAPSFRDVPPKPTDVRPPAAFRNAVAQESRASAQLQAYVAANPPMATASQAEIEAFAQSQRARIPMDERSFPSTPIGTEEFAARLRELATPPPPPQ
jgi:hypothetical protein